MMIVGGGKMDFCPKKKAGYISMGRVHGALRRPALAALQQQAAEPELSASQPLTTRTRPFPFPLARPLALPPFERGIRGGQAQAGTMMAAAALRPHKAPPARVPKRWVAALCAACFLLGVCVVNRSARPRPPKSAVLSDGVPARLQFLATLVLRSPIRPLRC